MVLHLQKLQNTQRKSRQAKRRYCNIATRLAKLMALPTAPQLPVQPSNVQQAAYNGYWLAVMARYNDVVSLQKWKGDSEWLPDYPLAFI